MLDFFLESAGRIADPRKAQITIRQMLQMRTGYPDEETDPAYLAALYWGEYLPLNEGAIGMLIFSIGTCLPQ